MFEVLSPYELDTNEYARIIEDVPNSYNGKIKVVIPKITPLLNCSEPNIRMKSFNPNIFVNTNDTKPNIDRTIRLRNYIEVKRFNGTYGKSYKKDEKVICIMMNKDIRDYYLTDFIGGD